MSIDSVFPVHTLFFMRSLPGNGKSMIAEAILGGKIANRSLRHPNIPEGLRVTECQNGVICSTDSYFYGEWESGEKNYEFQGSKIVDNHKRNQTAVEMMMENRCPAIVVDNTNVEIWHMTPYMELAEKYGFKIVVVEIPWISKRQCAETNSHGVPFDGICAMEDRWQAFNSVQYAGNLGKKVGA